MKIFYLWLFGPIALALFNLLFYLFEVKRADLFMPLFGFLIAFFNGLFFFFVYKKDKILAYFFQATAFLVGILVLVFLIRAL